MSGAWDGVPPNDGQDGLHWIDVSGPEPMLWLSDKRAWVQIGWQPKTTPEHLVECNAKYLGPCALPSEVAALRASNAEMLAALREARIALVCAVQLAKPDMRLSLEYQGKLDAVSAAIARATEVAS